MAARLSLCKALAVFAISACAAIAGFDDPWWDTDWHGYETETPESEYPVATNIYGRKWVIEWEQNSTTNYIPKLEWAFLARWSLDQEPFPFYRNWNETVGYLPRREPNYSIDGAFSDPSAYLSPLGSHSNASRSWTDCYVEWLQPDTYRYLSESTGYYAYAIWDATNPQYSPATNVYQFTNYFAAGSTTQSVTTTVTVHTEGAKTNLLLFAEDARAYDVYTALRTRWALLYNDYYRDARGTNWIGNGAIDDAYKPFLRRPMYRSQYTDKRFNIERLKAFTASLIPGFVDHYVSTNWSETWGTNHDVDFPALTVTQALAQAGAPSNYFTYTSYVPYTSPTFYGREIAQKYVIVCSDTNASCTNIVSDYTGVSRTLYGKHGDEKTIISTNLNIAEGFTEEDYGWKYLPIIITQSMTQIAFGWFSDGITTTNGGALYSNTWEEAKSAAESITNYSWFGGDPRIYPPPEPAYVTSGYYLGGYSAAFKSDAMTLAVVAPTNMPTNISCSVEVYVYSVAPRTISGLGTYSKNGMDNLEENKYALYHTFSNACGTQTVVIGSSSNIGEWCDEPPATNNVHKSKGYRILYYNAYPDYAQRPALFKYTITD